MSELSVADLTVRYGAVTALDDVSLVAPAASVTAVLGANGAGKTTLLRTISGLVHPVAGTIRFGDRDITRLAPEVVATLGVAQVPEGGGVIRELTVEENLRLGGLAARARNGSKDPTWVYEVFPQLGSRRRRPAFTLSGGERQMLAIGRALMARPHVMLLDEPSLGLAPLIVAEIMALLRRLSDESDLAVLLVEQNARSALSVADRAVVLHLGRVVKADDATAVAGDDGLRHAYLGF
jgi:branched-chain amino acid transport system ATP-binding protein